VLFDELLDAHNWYQPLTRNALQQTLAVALANIPEDDLERAMMVMRQFKHSQTLRVAAADCLDMIEVMVVSDYLTLIAEVILDHALRWCWRLLTLKHGAPPDTDAEHNGFAILGFGKLGGLELSYGSDLDLVFIYQGDNHAQTDGDKPVSVAQFYGRLGQRVMHMLNTQLLSGLLYEVDTRLRPSGNAGLLVSPIQGYQSYLEHQAWTYEHQALTRARCIAGDARLSQALTALRHDVLCRSRQPDTLRQDVKAMRRKMRSHLTPKSKQQFHLKHSLGGIADIEFIVQFLLLRWAHQHPDLITCSDNIRQLQALAEHGIISTEDACFLQESYRLYRDLGHHLVLQGLDTQVSGKQFREQRLGVIRIWRKILHANA
ncbi:MAG: bifunctional [glutamate--ammonia ligase]-adenylyl-L-tyrosine phosphorylase/[glutamate--ammonia-ligase] adenylyltransferase, partial [Methylococcales bacterium]|nr:bifunctional [glutamate--ammonia ligase]-adenylyl-L-tyrosine phosphorylase/[glutamate--ammonia-ligase] adenylyltransferase [Methylococcales bacterium]